MLLYLHFNGHTEASFSFVFMGRRRKRGGFHRGEPAYTRKQRHWGNYVNYLDGLVSMTLSVKCFLSPVILNWNCCSLVTHEWSISGWVYPSCTLEMCGYENRLSEIKGHCGEAEGWQWWEMRWRRISLKFYSHLAPSTPNKFLCAHGSLDCHRNLPFNHNRNLISYSWQRVLIA